MGDRLVAEPSSDLPRVLLPAARRKPGLARSCRCLAVPLRSSCPARCEVVLSRGREAWAWAGSRHVLSILQDGRVLVDGTDAGRTATIRLPSTGATGLMMVFPAADPFCLMAVVLVIPHRGREVGATAGNP